jgi:AraC-like DNA-binding protein
LTEKPQEDKNLPATAKSFEPKLKIWLDEKQFLQSGITIEDIAAKIGTNRRYLSEHINAGTGKTFRQWINELRIEEAKKLMRQKPEMSVNEVAGTVGFVNNSHFGRQFRLFTSTTPNEWRKNQSCRPSSGISIF